MRPQKHRCWGPDCTELVPMRLLMCPRHWALVPQELRQRVYDTNRQKHRGGRYAAEHHNACLAARNAITSDVALCEMRCLSTGAAKVSVGTFMVYDGSTPTMSRPAHMCQTCVDFAIECGMTPTKTDAP